LGGISFYILFLIAICSYFIFPFHNGENLGKELLALIGCVSTAFIVGFYDDTYNTNPMLKLYGQIFCGIILAVSGIVIPVCSYQFINIVLTILWTVFLMNSINMLDNMDGITTSVSITIILAAITLMVLDDATSSLYFITSIGVCAALIGFLFHNWNPSKIFMGDSGSQFLGAFLSFLSIVTMWKYKNVANGEFSVQQFLIPAVAFIIPIIDSVTVTIRRIARGQSPAVGGKDHTTHMLAYNGFSDKMVATTFFAISGFSVLIIYIIKQMFGNWNLVKSFAIIAYCICLFLAFQYMYNRGLKYKKMKE